MKLSGHHRTTLTTLFAHPVSHNIEWRDALSLLEAVGSVDREHSGRVKVTVGAQTQGFTAPHGHHEHALSEQQVVDVRSMLAAAGITPETVE